MFVGYFGSMRQSKSAFW